MDALSHILQASNGRDQGQRPRFMSSVTSTGRRWESAAAPAAQLPTASYHPKFVAQE